jgi:hypothetical protein
MGQPMQRVAVRGVIVHGDTYWQLGCEHLIEPPRDGGLSRFFVACPHCPDEADLPPLPEPERPPVPAGAIRAAIDDTVAAAEASRELASGPSLFDDYDDMPELPPARAYARRGDPATSRAAAVSLGDLRGSQRAVLTILRRYGAADFATLISRYAGESERDPETFPLQSESGIRTRVSELVGLDLVVDTGRRVRLDTGRQAVVWAVSSS